MKKVNLIILIAAIFYSCKEKEIPVKETGTVNVINAVTDGVPIKIRIAGQPKSWNGLGLQMVYPAAGLYYAQVGASNFTVVPIADTTKVLFNKTFYVKPTMYTLYLSGTAIAPDTMLREEVDYPNIITAGVNIPFSADSIVNVRFVNLSANCPPLNIKLSTAISNEVSSLSYKGISVWKTYSARLPSTTYSLQIRNAITDALITTYSFRVTAGNRFKNVALVIRGVFGTTTGTAPFGVTAVNYY